MRPLLYHFKMASSPIWIKKTENKKPKVFGLGLLHAVSSRGGNKLTLPPNRPFSR